MIVNRQVRLYALKHQYIEQMDEKPEDYSREDDAGLDLIDFYVLPHYLIWHHLKKLPRK